MYLWLTRRRQRLTAPRMSSADFVRLKGFGFGSRTCGPVGGSRRGRVPTEAECRSPPNRCPQAVAAKLAPPSRHRSANGREPFPQPIPGLPHNGPGRDIEVRPVGTAVPAPDAAAFGVPGHLEGTASCGTDRRPGAPPQVPDAGSPVREPPGNPERIHGVTSLCGRMRARPETASSPDPSFRKQEDRHPKAPVVCGEGSERFRRRGSAACGGEDHAAEADHGNHQETDAPLQQGVEPRIHPFKAHIHPVEVRIHPVDARIHLVDARREHPDELLLAFQQAPRPSRCATRAS